MWVRALVLAAPTLVPWSLCSGPWMKPCTQDGTHEGGLINTAGQGVNRGGYPTFRASAVKYILLVWDWARYFRHCMRVDREKKSSNISSSRVSLDFKS